MNSSNLNNNSGIGSVAGVTQAIQTAVKKDHITLTSSQQILANLTAANLPKTIGSQIPKLEGQMPIVLNFLVDRTGSMKGFEAVVVKAINNTAADFKKMRLKTGQEIYLSVKTFAQMYDGSPIITVLQDFVHIQDFIDLVESDYRPEGDTPLFDAYYDGVTQTMAFGASAFSYGAFGVEEITIVLTDGRNNASVQRTDQDVADFLVELNTRPNFVAAMIGLGTYDYFSVGKGMGLLDGNIIAVEKTDTGITKALKLVTSSVGSRSQSKMAKQPLSSGGFFTNQP